MSGVIQVKEIDNQAAWDEAVKHHDGHPLQLWGWGEVKAAHGWQVSRVAIEANSEIIAGASLLIKKLPEPFHCLVYIARGPWGSWNDTSREKLETYIRQSYKPVNAVAEPDTTEDLSWKGWKRSENRILLRRTAVMDLTRSLEDLLGNMSKKTRQYIRKSGGEGTVIRLAKTKEDIDECLSIYEDTAKRANFALHERSYYHDIFAQLADYSPVYMATYGGKVIAFLWPIVTPEVAFELYGGMSDEGQRLRANYHLKWHVIQEMKRQNVKRYDVNGLLNDGVTTFKKGFIPDETYMAGTYEKGMSVWYPLWRYALPFAKRAVQLVRRLGGR